MDFKFPDCGGCRSCELACSYHLLNEFDISKGAIEINECPEGGYRVTIHQSPSGTRLACDGCVGLDMPLCVRYCHAAETLMEQVALMRQGILKPQGKEGEPNE